LPPPHETPPLNRFVADELGRQANDLTDQWLGHLSTTAGAHPFHLLAAEELREHIPELVRDIAEYTHVPVDAARSGVIDRLRLHAERRREQGYDIQQLLTEFEMLSRIVFGAFSEVVRGYPGVADPGEVADLAGRLREGLMQITSDAVGIYRQQELRLRRRLAERLADFARTIGHELKNPLGAAQVGTQMLQEEAIVQTSEDRNRFTEMILRNLVRMHDLIDDIYALALAEEAEGVERWIPIDRAVEKVFEEVRERAQEKGVRLEVEGAVPDVWVDAIRVEIALVNLVGNAIKYSDPGKQERWVKVGVERVTEGEPAEVRWQIRVADNGLGIPKALQGNVFQRHFRAHPDRAKGTGFGLAITHEVVTVRGGRIWFESEETRGTTFYFVVPGHEDEPEIAGAKVQP